MKLNVRMLRRIQRIIRAEPKRLGMANWVRTLDPEEDEHAPACGTVACIAGWAVILNDLDKKGLRLTRKPIKVKKKREGFDYSFYGGKVLGLEPEGKPGYMDTALDLFQVTQWPESFRHPYRYAESDDNYERMAEITCARIDHFIDEHRA